MRLCNDQISTKKVRCGLADLVIPNINPNHVEDRRPLPSCVGRTTTTPPFFNAIKLMHEFVSSPKHIVWIYKNKGKDLNAFI